MTAALVGFIALFALLLFGLPIAFSMLAAGALGLFMVGGDALTLGILRAAPLSSVNSFELITIPMFILMAEFILVSGVADDIFRTASAWFGRVRGGLAMATAVAGAAFGAICGSSTASAATLASTTIPAMVSQGYNRQMSAGVVAISGTMAMLIPPSVAIVVYALLSHQSIAAMLIAGIVPGLLVCLTVILTIRFLVWRKPEHAPAGEVVSWEAKLASLRSSLVFLLLFGAVTAVLYTGVATPTEAAAMGALAAFLVALFRGRLNRMTMTRSLYGATRTTAMILLIIVGAHVFGYFLTVTQTTQAFVQYASSLDVPRVVILAVILVVYLLLGCVMDQMAILFLTVPVVHPLIVALGYSPLWFGILIIVIAEVGMVTPPMGMNVFVVSRYTGIPLDEAFRGVWPHVVAHLVLIVVLVMFPQLVLWPVESMH